MVFSCAGLQLVTRETFNPDGCHDISVLRPTSVMSPLQGAPRFPNLSAKHEGKDSEIEGAFTHPSDILNRYLEGIFLPGDMPHLELNYLDKHATVNRTAKAQTERDLGFVAA